MYTFTKEEKKALRNRASNGIICYSSMMVAAKCQKEECEGYYWYPGLDCDECDFVFPLIPREEYEQCKDGQMPPNNKEKLWIL